VNNTPQPAPFFSENPSVIWSKCVYHHSSTCRVQSPRELEILANEIYAGSLRGTSTEAHAMTVCMAFLLTTSRAVGSKRVSRAGSDDIRRSSNCPSNTCDRLEVAISDRNVARLCVRQDLGHHCPSPQAVSDALLTCVSTGLRLRPPEGNSLMFGCYLAGHLGCVIIAIVQKSMPAIGITVLWSKRCH
jgi:hypothetical protein